jgi:type I restriction enzyme M protein
VDGREELSFEVSRAGASGVANPFQVNPYVTGAPVDSEGTFFGREDVIDRIHRLLRTEGPSTVILLEGNRRAGKTSTLKRLQKSEHLKDWVPVYCQFQGISGEPNAQSLYRLVARELLNGVAASAAGAVPEQLRSIVEASNPLERITLSRGLAASIGEERPFERFEELIQLSLAAIRPKRVLLMLDEFEKIHQGIEQHQMSALVPENFRYLFQTYSELSGILSGSIRIKRLRKEYWNVLFGIGTPIAIGPLKPAPARELVIRPAEGILSYSDQAIERILELCGFQPFLIQSLASAIFEACASSNLSSVTTELVNQSAHALVLNNEHFYTVFRQQSLTARQRFLACLIDSLTDASTRVTFDVIRDQLEDHGIAVESDVQLKADLEDLQEREIIVFVPDTPVGYYRIEVPLFSQWLRAKVDFQAERREAIEE